MPTIEGIVPREILDGPNAIRVTVDEATDEVAAIASALRERGVRRIWLIGNGTSYHSCLQAAGVARRLGDPDDPAVLAVTAGEFRAAGPRIGPRDALVGISASGEFRDVIGAFETVRGRIPTIGIVHVPESTIGLMSDYLIVSKGGPSTVPVMTKTFSATLTATLMLVGALVGERSIERTAAGLRKAATDAEEAIHGATELVEQIGDQIASSEHVFVVGAGLAYPAALEAALKLKEMALVHAEASETWEMASGPATIVGPGSVVISLRPDGAAHDATDEIVRHCHQWGARIIEVATTGTLTDAALLPVPSVDERYAPLVFVPPVALLAYVLAVHRGANPDSPHWTARYHQQGLRHILGS
jgi:glucosamine--fructose-6-phosphate aminotransferase (isomerizing)